MNTGRQTRSRFRTLIGGVLIVLLGMAALIAGVAYFLRDRRSFEPPAMEVTVLEPQLSSIATPVTIPLEQLRRLADRRLSGELYRERREVATGVQLDIAVRRRADPIAMNMTAGWLTTTVPLNVVGTPSLNLGRFRLPGGSAGELDADIDVTMQTRARLGADWSLRAETTAEIEVGRADLEVAGRSISVAPIVREGLRRNVDRLTEPLDAYLRNLDVRSMMDPIWQRFRSPIQLSEEPPVWLQVRPEGFSLSPPDLQADDIRFDIGMEMYLESIVGERPGDIELGDIPPLREVSGSAGHFSVAIPISIELDEATRLLASQIVGREDAIGEDAVVRWRDIDLRGDRNRLTAAVGFDAETGLPIIRRLSGRMVLEGTPRFDPSSETLTMEHVDYELEADSVWARLADWFVHDQLRQQIQSAMVFPMGDIIADVRGDLESGLASISFGEYGTAEAEIGGLVPNLVGIADDRLESAIVADGTFRLRLDLAP